MYSMTTGAANLDVYFINPADAQVCKGVLADTSCGHVANRFVRHLLIVWGSIGRLNADHLGLFMQHM